ncbi:MAG: tail fiber domain-containing protein [Elusimicrobia bacterium]|nr:tail fiber domain-containing protein [Elusimicrobiota bacterium]
MSSYKKEQSVRGVDMKKNFSKQASLAFLALLASLALSYSEQVTVTSMYPSPLGVFKKIRVVGDSFLAVTSGNVGIGTASSTSGKLIVMGGNVGIGTATPNQGSLHVNTNLNVYAIYAKNTYAGSNAIGIGSYPQGAAPFGAYGLDTSVSGGANNYGVYASALGGVGTNNYAGYFMAHLYVADGNAYFADRVGIGTTNIISNLDVYDGNSQAYLTINHGLSTVNGELRFHQGATFKGAVLSYGSAFALTPNCLALMTGSATNAHIIFAPANPIDGTTAVERMRLTTAGNLGIGDASPDASLEVVNDGAGDSFIVADTNDGDLTPFVINATGKVGIGIAAPLYPLHISGGVNRTFDYHFYARPWSSASGGASCLGCTGSLSIYASARVAAEEFNAHSDERIKNVLGPRSQSADLGIINKLRIVNYSYIDQVNKGQGLKAGLIAQEVEGIYPQAVHKATDFVPSIFAFSSKIAPNAGANSVAIHLPKAHQLEKGDLVRIITDKKELEKKVARVVSDSIFEVGMEEWPAQTESVFVYGKKVDDFRILDYDQLFTLGLSAIQDMSQRVSRLSQENESMKLRLDKLEKRLAGK